MFELAAISLESNGYACSAWLQPQKQRTEKPKKKPQVPKPPIAYEKRVDYFAKVDYFVGSEAALPQIIDAGSYRYDFSVQLPQSCASSYEGTHGHIRYTLQLMICRSDDQPVEMAQQRQLQVMQRCETNLSTGELMAPSEVHCIEETPTMKFWQRPLQLQVDIPRSGYEPGESISVHVKLYNQQQLPLKTLIYKLNQVSSYVGQQKSKSKRVATNEERRNLVSSSHQLEGVSRQGLLHFQHLHNLLVPQTPPTMSSTICACLQLGYEIEVVVQTTTLERFIVARVPIIIVSAAASQKSAKEQAMARSQLDLHTIGVASAPNQTPDPSTATMTAPNLCVSTTSLASNFREAEFMMATNLNKKDKHAMSGENIDFRPRYLYYEMEHAETEKVL